MLRSRLTNRLTAHLDEIADELEQVDPRVALALDQVSDGLEKTAAGYYEKLLIDDGKHKTEIKSMFKYMMDPIKEAEDRWENTDLPYDMDKIVEYAKKVYDPNDDYHGVNFIRQTLPREDFQNFSEGKFSDPEEFLKVLKKLEDWAKKSISDLKAEAKKKNITLE